MEAAGSFVSARGRIGDNLNVSRGLGDHGHKGNPDLPLAQQAVSPEPDVHVIARNGRERFLVLASDGLWETLSNNDAAVVLQRTVGSSGAVATINAQKCAERLVDEALLRGSTDNITALVCAFTGPGAGVGAESVGAGGAAGVAGVSSGSATGMADDTAFAGAGGGGSGSGFAMGEPAGVAPPLPTASFGPSGGSGSSAGGGSAIAHPEHYHAKHGHGHGHHQHGHGHHTHGHRHHHEGGAAAAAVVSSSSGERMVVEHEHAYTRISVSGTDVGGHDAAGGGSNSSGGGGGGGGGHLFFD